jgi:UDP-N-acetylmuramoyl-tripeptide--D-alanyl-D-alanine ligase
MKKIIRNLVEKILTACAKTILWRHNIKIIAITGSAGKTTTKTMVGSVLKEGLGNQVLIGFGNLGTISGLPLALLNFQVNILDSSFGGLYLLMLTILALLKTFWLLIWPFYYTYGVFELTADRPGDLHLISQYLKPDVSIVTNVGQAHLEYFKNLEGVAKEKVAIAKYAKKTGLVILNGQDPYVLGMKDKTQASVKIVKVRPYLFGPEVSRIVGHYFGLNDTDIENGLKKVILPRGRFDIFKGKKQTQIIDSTYNSNPVSVKATLEQLDQVVKSSGRKIIVLGDMLELGDKSDFYHQEVGKIARPQADILVAVGPRSSKNMPADFKTESIDRAYQYIIDKLRPGDTVFIKASHSMHLQDLVNKLKV